MSRFLLSTCVSLALATATFPATAERSRPAAIEGTWQSACMPIGKNGRHGFTVRLTLTRKTVVALWQTYAHNTCDTPTVRVDYTGRIVARVATADAVDFDHVLASITMTPNAPDVVDIYNRTDSPTAGCSMGGGWQLNVSRPIAGRNCAPLTPPVVGTRLYERAWLTADGLKIGSFPVAWTNTAPDKRPTMPGLLTFRRVAN